MGNPDEDITIGLELNLMSQEQVVSEFRELVSKDLATAALRYNDFAQKLEHAASHDNAQVRSLAGGPDSSSRAELIDIMVGNYAFASDDVKERVLELAVGPLLRDNSFYVQLAIVKMKNPYVVADIIRKYPLFNPSAGFYEDDLLKDDNLASPGSIQKWLNELGVSNFYAAMAIALQGDHSLDVGIVMEANKELFEGAAHIVASHHDFIADRKVAANQALSKPELLQNYRAGFVDEFASMVSQKSIEANWLKAASL